MMRSGTSRTTISHGLNTKVSPLRSGHGTMALRNTASGSRICGSRTGKRPGAKRNAEPSNRVHVVLATERGVFPTPIVSCPPSEHKGLRFPAAFRHRMGLASRPLSPPHQKGTRHCGEDPAQTGTERAESNGGAGGLRDGDSCWVSEARLRQVHPFFGRREPPSGEVHAPGREVSARRAAH